jgi:glucosamine--fructose-6-phosphate aminotransferase (isomerizing)
MCGIFGIVLLQHNSENMYNLIINGLIQLQNRGYDSCGLSILNNNNNNNNNFEVIKCASTNEINAIDRLLQLINENSKTNNSSIGIGHNRWATHGMKTDVNAHPHLSNDRNFVIVHNGIIENYHIFKSMLQDKGFTFFSQTDTEIIVNLIQYNYSLLNNTFEAIRKTISELNGTYGLIIQSSYEPNKLFCVRNGSPLLIGQTEDRVVITSEQSGFCNMVSNYITLNNDDICIIEQTALEINLVTNNVYLKKKITEIECVITPYPYNHWTLKEINDQPNTIMNTINKGGRIKSQTEVKLGGLEQCAHNLKNIKNIIILGCGTSFFAGLYGMYFFKQICNFNTVQVFDGAEFNNYDIPKIGETAFILISQSGETKDLHRCIEIAKSNNITTIGIINVVDSLIGREVDCGIYCNAGKEVGVASTKSFTSQVVCLSLAALWFAQLHNINENKRVKMISDLHNLSNDFKNTLECCSEQIKEISKKMRQNNMFLLGKGSDEYIAKEGSLKIKEISYIHSEGYSSSSLKHGPFALLDENMPVVILNLDQTHRAKTLNCCQEVASRNSPIILITNTSDFVQGINCETVLIPENKTYSSLLGVIPIQLLAYYLSVDRGINPDKPKNLAKVVTVE